LRHGARLQARVQPGHADGCAHHGARHRRNRVDVAADRHRSAQHRRAIIRARSIRVGRVERRRRGERRDAVPALEDVRGPPGGAANEAISAAPRMSRMDNGSRARHLTMVRIMRCVVTEGRPAGRRDRQMAGRGDGRLPVLRRLAAKSAVGSQGRERP